MTKKTKPKRKPSGGKSCYLSKMLLLAGVGDVIKERRLELGYNSTKIIEKIGIDRIQLYRLEANQRCLNNNHMAELLDFLGLRLRLEIERE